MPKGELHLQAATNLSEANYYDSDNEEKILDEVSLEKMRAQEEWKKFCYENQFNQNQYYTPNEINFTSPFD